MPSLPVISGKEAMAIFRKFGWEIDRRESSHVVMKKAGEPNRLSIPDHRELNPGTLRTLIARARLTVQEFVDAMKRK